MELILSSFGFFMYGVYISLCEKNFNNRVRKRISRKQPLTDENIIKMSESCHLRRKKFKIMEKNLKLKIANKIKM